MKLIKPVGLLLAALCLTLCLAACGGQSSPEGYYTLTCFNDPENDVEYDESMLLFLNMAEDYLYLEADGTGRLVLFSEELEVAWTETQLTFTATGQSSDLAFSKDQAVLDMGGLKLTYTRSEDTPPEAGAFPSAELE